MAGARVVGQIVRTYRDEGVAHFRAGKTQRLLRENLRAQFVFARMPRCVDERQERDGGDQKCEHARDRDFESSLDDRVDGGDGDDMQRRLRMSRQNLQHEHGRQKCDRPAMHRREHERQKCPREAERPEDRQRQLCGEHPSDRRENCRELTESDFAREEERAEGGDEEGDGAGVGETERSRKQ